MHRTLARSLSSLGMEKNIKSRRVGRSLLKEQKADDDWLGVPLVAATYQIHSRFKSAVF